jgi:hypothetical protein
MRPYSVTGVSIDGHGAVVDVEGPEGREAVRARYVVGADGVGSVARQSAKIAFAGGSYDQSFTLADARVEWPLPFEEVQNFFSPAGIVVSGPLPDNQRRVLATVGKPPEVIDVDFVQNILDERGPTRLRVPDLLRATDQAADDVLSGRCDHLLPAGAVPESRRWFTRIHGDDELDIWLISWVPGHPTKLHDHGGSLGALTVLSGSLNEFRWDGRGLQRRRLDAGDQAGFPLGWVHDVVWAPRPVSRPVPGPVSTNEGPVQPTLSVHAYSPPLTAMSYYEITDRNRLRRQRTELTDQPEGPQ